MAAVVMGRASSRMHPCDARTFHREALGVGSRGTRRARPAPDPPTCEPSRTRMPIETPDDAPRPGRLIIPGAERRARPTGSRIVLPPGARVDDARRAARVPAAAPADALPVRATASASCCVVNDPLGVMPGQPVLRHRVARRCSSCSTARVSLTDITAAVMRESKDLRVGNMVSDFIAPARRAADARVARASRRPTATVRDGVPPARDPPAALEGAPTPPTRAELRDVPRRALRATAEPARDRPRASRRRRRTRCRARCWRRTSTRAAPGPRSRAPTSRSGAAADRAAARRGVRHRPLADRRRLRAHAQALRDAARRR